MTITFLFGNGFDIGLGMPTRFADFYEKYCKTDSSTENIHDFKKCLEDWLRCDGKKCVSDWSDFEIEFGKHSLDFTATEKQKYLERFEDFVVAFNLYLEKVEKCTDLEDISNITKTMNDALVNYKNLRREDADEITAFYSRFNQKRTYNFATFNYTKTVDAFYNALKIHLKHDDDRNIGKLIHIHGYIEDSMIIGVNDPSQILNNEFASDPEVTEVLVKTQQNMTSRTGHDKDLSTTINSSNIICIYGASIGDTDKKWWDHISKWLEQSKERILIILQYNPQYSPRVPHIQTRCTKAVLEKFLGFSSLSNEKKQKISKQIYIGFNNNVFELNLFNAEKFDNDYLSHEEIEEALSVI